MDVIRVIKMFFSRSHLYLASFVVVINDPTGELQSLTINDLNGVPNSISKNLNAMLRFRLGKRVSTCAKVTF
jgi:hypothetical protein